MRGYKVTAKFGKDTIKFELPIGVPQENMNEAYNSAREYATDAFGLNRPLTFPETLVVTVEEYYTD